MKIAIKNIEGKKQGELEVKFPLIEDGKGTQAVHDVVVAYQAAQRMGTACTKNVGEVSGSNKKPWRQKGTGRARAGSHQSPLWVGGGVVFGPRPRDFSKKVSKKHPRPRVAQGVERTAQGRRRGVGGRFETRFAEDEGFCRPDVHAGVDRHDADRRAADKNLTLASRNIENVTLATSDSLNTYDILRPDKLLFTKSAFEKVEARLTKE